MKLIDTVFLKCNLLLKVNSEISGEAYIEKNYTLNVMVSGIGIIFGPILSGYFKFLYLK